MSMPGFLWLDPDRFFFLLSDILDGRIQIGFLKDPDPIVTRIRKSALLHKLNSWNITVNVAMMMK